MEQIYGNISDYSLSAFIFIKQILWRNVIFNIFALII